MSAELLQLLIETVLAASAAAAAVLCLRLPVRRSFGARTAYVLWLLVPAAILAVLLPAPRIEAVLPAATLRAAAGTVQPMAAAPAAAIDFSVLLVLAWALGACALAAALVLRQMRFRCALGILRALPDGSWRADSSLAGPAVIGALRGRVVLPADFDERYTPLQRELVLRHERVHVARFDLAANLLASALRCLHWFNPLLHYAVGRFRFDQELAADALVLAQRPDARRDYADAMLATQLLADPPPLGCHWQPAHPLKERIMMLKQPLPGALRSAFGAMLALGLALGTGYAAWASQPARAGDALTDVDEEALGLRVTLRVGDEAVLVHEVLAKAGAHASVVQSSDGLEFDFIITSLTDETIGLSGTVRREGNVISRPSIQFHRGDAASITVAGPDSGLREDASFDFVFGSVAQLRAAPRAQSRGEADLLGATYARLSPPKYPAEALASKVQGTVLLRVLVGIDGAPARVQIDRSSGDARLDAAAQAKVRDWRFNPARQAGQAVEGWVQVPVTFSLDGGNTGSPTLPPGALDEIYIKAPQG